MSKCMTWSEFKEFIDKELGNNKVDPNSEIWYIDISFPSKEENGPRSIYVSFDEKLGISIQ